MTDIKTTDLTSNEIARIFAMYFPECEVMTPDGKGILTGMPMGIKQYNRLTVHFGRNMVHTKNSIDGHSDKVRNYGEYNICSQRLVPIKGKYDESDIINIPGGVKLLLTPLEKITDEHAIEVQKVLHIEENEAGYETNGAAIKNCLVRDGFYAIELFSFYAGVSDVFQYLISKGYAVPLWFGIDHPCNGKTAIELGIAIEK